MNLMLNLTITMESKILALTLKTGQSGSQVHNAHLRLPHHQNRRI